MIDRKIAFDIVVACLRDALDQLGEPTAEIGEETIIIGQGAALDSVGVVALIVDVEQRLEMDHDVSITLANDKAMSQKNSPFRTAGVLTDHVLETIKEREAA